MVSINIYRDSTPAKTLVLDQVLLQLNGKPTNITSDAKGIAGAKLTESGKNDSVGYFGTFVDTKGNTLTFSTKEKPDVSFSDILLLRKMKTDYKTAIMLVRS